MTTTSLDLIEAADLVEIGKGHPYPQIDARVPPVLKVRYRLQGKKYGIALVVDDGFTEDQARVFAGRIKDEVAEKIQEEPRVEWVLLNQKTQWVDMETGDETEQPQWSDDVSDPFSDF